MFRAHVVNLQREPLDPAVCEIVAVRKYRSLGAIPNGLAVTTASGQEHRFVVGQRDRLIAGIDTHRGE